VTVRHTYWQRTVDRDTMMSGASMGWTQQWERLEEYVRVKA
jgi:hypothetical protein